MRKLLFALTTLFFSLNLFAQVSGVDPSLHWKIARSAHFDLVFDAQQQELADLYLDRLERARKKLSRLWLHMPDRFTVVLNDRTDLTNGFATPIPYPEIMVYPVLPGPSDTISEYNDWAEEIVLHEMTHIFSFEKRRGTMKVLSNIFGSIITPNILLPTWWLEGLAVDGETRLSNNGRLRSTLQDASIRALASKSEWFGRRLSEINEQAIPTYPYGSRPYLYGSLMWSEMIALSGEKMIDDLHESMGGRVPYFLSGSVTKRFAGQDLPGIWARTKQDVYNAVENQQKKLLEVPLSVTEKFQDPQFLEVANSRISPDGMTMAIMGKDSKLIRSIYLLRRNSKSESFKPADRAQSSMKMKPVDLPEGPFDGTINRLSWAADSKSFVFDLTNEKDWFHDVSDLWQFSVATGKAKQMTFGLRAREPQMSPDGTMVAYTGLESLRTTLGVWNLQTKTAKQIYRPALGARVSWPVWLSSDRILVTVRDHGVEKFLIVTVSTGAQEWPHTPFKDVETPFVSGGRLYFTSAANGVRNVYSSTLAMNDVKPMTHLWTGAADADLDEAKQELWITQIAATGDELVKKPNAPVNVALPRVEPLLNDRYPAVAVDNSPLVPPEKVDEYSALHYMWPRYWIPFIGSDGKSTDISVTTGGADPLGHHAYSLFGAYDTAINRMSYQALYQNQNFRPTLTLSAVDLSSYLADPNQKTRTQNYVGSIQWQLEGLDPYLLAGLRWSEIERESDLFGSPKSNQTGPSAFVQYNLAEQTGDQISPESGGAAGLQTTQFIAGSDGATYNLTSASVTKFGKMPFGQHHAWMARIQGQKVDRKILLSDFDSTVTTLAVTAPLLQTYLMRGYVTGAFVGKSIANGNFEYRFPVTRFDRGSDYFPLFLQRLSGALVSDWIAVDGFVYNTKGLTSTYDRVQFGKVMGSAGLEAKLEFDLGYHLPMEAILGVYEPLSTRYNNSSPQFNLSLAL